MNSQSTATVLVTNCATQTTWARVTSNPARSAPTMAATSTRRLFWPRLWAVLLLGLVVLLALFGKRLCFDAPCGWTVGQAQFSSPA